MESVIWFFCSPKKGFFTLSCPHFCSTLMTFFCWCWKGILFLPCAMRLVLLLPLPFSDCKKTYTRQRMPRLLQSIAKVYLRYLYCPLICGEDKVRSLKETMSIYFPFLLYSSCLDIKNMKFNFTTYLLQNSFWFEMLTKSTFVQVGQNSVSTVDKIPQKRMADAKMYKQQTFARLVTPFWSSRISRA